MAKARRILCYAVNGAGLGHATRLCTLSRWMRRILWFAEGRTPEIAFLTTTEAPALLSAAGFPAFKLPSKTIWRSSGLDVAEYRQMAKHFIWQTIGCFDPDLLLVDTFPTGAFDELMQILDGSFAKCLVSRQVKESFSERPAFRAALSLYDRVVRPHAEANCERLEGVKSQYFSGVVISVERESVFSREKLHELLGLPLDMQVAYLSAGGGGDPNAEETLSACLDVLLSVPNLFVLVGAGPLYRGKRRFGARICWWTEPSVASLMGACDFAVSAAGYNSFHELMHLGVPTIFYAQEKTADEQDVRVAEAAEVGACLVWDREQPLLSLVERCMAESQTLRERALAFCPENGARRGAEQILATILPLDRLSAASAMSTTKFVQLSNVLSPDDSLQIARTATRLAGPVKEDAERLILSQLMPRLSQSAQSEVSKIIEQSSAIGPQIVDALCDLMCELFAFENDATPGSLNAEPICNLVKLVISRQAPMISPEATPDAISAIRVYLKNSREKVSISERLQLLRACPRLAELSVPEAISVLEKYTSATSHLLLRDRVLCLQSLSFGRSNVTQADVEALYA